MTARRRWTRRLARACLRTWPAPTRAKHGPSVILAMLEQLEGGRDGASWLPWLVLECMALVGSGASMRLASLRSAMVRATTGTGADARVALRGLRRNPGFTAAAVATVAVGIGGAAAVVATVDGVLYTPGPYEEPERLGLVWNVLGDDPARIRVAAPDVAVLRASSRQLEGIAWINRVTDGSLESAAGDAVTHVRVATVTHDLFDLLGVQPMLGRGFRPEDGPTVVSGGTGPIQDGPRAGSAPPAVLVSHELWRSALGADADALGRTLRLNGRPAVLVGVLPPSFLIELPPDAGIASQADVWVPVRVPLAALRRQEGRLRDQDSDNTGVAIARLRSGVPFDRARMELAEIGARLQELVPAYRTADLGFELRPMHEDARQHAEGVGTVLFAGALVLLLVTSLNLATLVLARGAHRAPELSVRLALGSHRFGIVRALALESVLIVGLGITVALTFAGLLSELLTRGLPPALALLGGGPATGRFVWVSGIVSLILLLSLGTLPAVRLAGRASVSGVRRRGAGAGRVRGLLVGSQVALSVALMTSALLLVRSADRIRSEWPGFDAEGALSFSLSLRMPDRYSGPADRARLMAEIGSALEALPDVDAVGLVGGLPLSGDRWTQPYGLPGQAEHEWPENRADFRVVTAGLFDALGIRLLEGRVFTSDEDLYEDRRVVIVDRALAELVAPGGSALGRTIGFPLDGDPVSAEIVGVVERARYDDLAAFGREALYVPYRQEASRDVSFVVRSVDSSNAALDRLAESIPGVIRGIDPQVPVYDLRAMSDYLDAAQAPVRFALGLVGVFAILTLLAASVGVYGVVSYEAASRNRELGLRMAVGASAAEVRRLMLSRGLLVGAAGGGAGLVLCMIAVFTARSSTVALATVSGASTVRVSDPYPWLVGTGVAVGLTLLASLWPAYRAGRSDPLVALRSER